MSCPKDCDRCALVREVIRERTRQAYVDKALELMDAYREAELRGECDFGSVQRAANALLNHAYNEGKAP